MSEPHKKLHNVVLAKYQLSGNGPYLFAVPDGRNLKREQTVIVEMREGIATDGVCVTDSFRTDDTSLNAMVILSGAKRPPRRVLGERQAVIWEEKHSEPEVAENKPE